MQFFHGAIIHAREDEEYSREGDPRAGSGGGAVEAVQVEVLKQVVVVGSRLFSYRTHEIKTTPSYSLRVELVALCYRCPDCSLVLVAVKQVLISKG